MKSIKTIIGLVIFTTLLSSCGSLSISQKRYSRGLNIDLFTSKDEKPMEFKAAKAEKKQVVVLKKQAPTIQNDENISTTDNEKIEIVTNNIKKLENKKVTKKIISKIIEVKLDEDKNSNQIKKSLTLIPETIQEKNGSDTSTLLLILLALILPPLAVFLYFDEINFHFWLNIILVLVGGGFILSGGALFYVGAAFIHALLVIFGLFG